MLSWRRARLAYRRQEGLSRVNDTGQGRESRHTQDGDREVNGALFLHRTRNSKVGTPKLAYNPLHEHSREKRIVLSSVLRNKRLDEGIPGTPYLYRILRTLCGNKVTPVHDRCSAWRNFDESTIFTGHGAPRYCPDMP